MNPAVQTFVATSGVAMGAGVAALVLAHGVKTLVNMQLDAAARKMAEEKAKFQAWTKFQQEQLRQMSQFRELEAAIHAAEQQLAGIELEAVVGQRAAMAASGPDAPSAKGHLALGRSRMQPEEIQQAFSQLANIVEALPAAFREAAGSPYAKLIKQRDKLAERLKGGERLQRPELAAFKELLTRTLEGFTNESSARHRQQEELHARLESALNDVLLYRALASPPQTSALDSLCSQVASLLTSDAVKLGQLELLENRLASVKKEVDGRVINKAHRTGLCESLTRNLSELGYETAAAFADDPEQATLQSVLKVPGGERIEITLQEDNQLSFRMLHERIGQQGGLLQDELAHIRKQEGRWCQDFKELVRRLVAEGFSYEVRLERLIPDQAIKVVVVETAGEILSREHEEEDERYAGEDGKRYLS